jgi:uncharacterized membrane protein (DUF4010 family)
MPAEFYNAIPSDILKFLLVALFALLIGLEQRRHNLKAGIETLFGTDRTFTLTGILGFILYIISPQSLVPFLCGGGALTLLLSIFYYQKITQQKKFGGTALIIALITYCLTPLIYTQPAWLVLLVVVCVLVLTELKETLLEFSAKFDETEFMTLAKFLVLAGVILPLLPNKPFSDQINITPYKFGLSIIAVSGISYLSYLLKKFVFPNSGIILTGILGGLYSSTATTIILARKTKESPESKGASAAIVLTTTMMYLRIFLLAFIFNQDIAFHLTIPLAILAVTSACMAFYLYRRNTAGAGQTTKTAPVDSHPNPLELKTALVFAVLFIFFAVITGFVNTHYGSAGIGVLSFVVGITDINPFILTLFQSKISMANTVIIIAVLNAVASNNLFVLFYGVALSDKSVRKSLIITFCVLIALGLMMSFVFSTAF